MLDKNTDLVWEKSPITTDGTWDDARLNCIRKSVGGQKGWRLPSVHELASLVDPSVASPGPTLPPGHPFLKVQPVSYWSAATTAENPPNAWNVSFGLGEVIASPKISHRLIWCVRGPMSESVY